MSTLRHKPPGLREIVTGRDTTAAISTVIRSAARKSGQRRKTLEGALRPLPQPPVPVHASRPQPPVPVRPSRPRRPPSPYRRKHNLRPCPPLKSRAFSSIPSMAAAKKSDEVPKTHKKTMRDYTALEMVSTEEKYIGQLQELLALLQSLIDKKAYKESSAPSKALLLDAKGEIERLLQINTVLLDNLHRKGQDAFGVVFTEFGPFLKMYSVYLTKCEDYKKAFREYECDAVFKMKASSLLQAPVTRVPRYILLLKDLLKRTPTEHIDYGNLQEALRIVKVSMTSVNAAMATAEQTHAYRKFFDRFGGTKPLRSHSAKMEQLQKLAPNRRLLKTSVAYKVNRRGKTDEVELFLIEDHLCYAAKDSGHITKAVPLLGLTIGDKVDPKVWLGNISEDAARYKAHAFMLNNPHPIKSFVVLATTALEKSDYVNMVRDQIIKLKREVSMEQRAVSAFRRSSAWKPNTPNCMGCDTAFSFFHRPHHCRSCGDCVCSDCLVSCKRDGETMRFCKTCDSKWHQDKKEEEALALFREHQERQAAVCSEGL